MTNVFPTAPNYDDVRWPAKGGLRVPTEVYNAHILVGKELDLNLATLVSPLQLSPDQSGARYFTLTGATGAFTIQFPFGYQSKDFAVANHSGQTVTFQMAAGPGVAASTGIAVANGFRQQLCVDRQVADVRPLAAPIAY